MLPVGRGLVARELGRAGCRRVVDVGADQVLRDVDEHRSRAAGRGDVESLVDVVGDLPRVRHQQRVLDDGQRDADDVRLLEAVRADQVGADLAGDEDGGDRVHHRVGDRRDEVRRARARGGDCDAHASRGLRVALRHVAGALLVTGLDVRELRVVDRVVEGQVGAAGDAEDVFDPLVGQCLAKSVRGAHRMRWYLAPDADHTGVRPLAAALPAPVPMEGSDPARSTWSQPSGSPTTARPASIASSAGSPSRSRARGGAR